MPQGSDEGNISDMPKLHKSLDMSDSKLCNSRIGYGDKAMSQKDRWAAKAERYEAWATAAEEKASAIYASHESARKDHALWTQPAYVGTAGGRRLQRQRQTVRDALSRAHELNEKAKNYRGRAANLRAMANRNVGDAERQRQAARSALDSVLAVGDEVSTLFGVRRVTKINAKTIRVEGVSCAIEKHLCKRVPA